MAADSDAGACEVAVIGAGPAGLAAAEAAMAAGARVTIFEAKPSPARKFLMAGKSGLNLTKDEPRERFLHAYGAAAGRLRPMIETFGPIEAVAWAEGLGEAMFVGSSGRVFPRAMKASPLLRRWLGRLSEAELRRRWRWTGWEGRALAFQTPHGARRVQAGAVVLATGGASWPRLGSDGAWSGLLMARGVPVAPFRPANMGFDVAWSEPFRRRFSGAAVKTVRLSATGPEGPWVPGEFVISEAGIEGGGVYAVSAALRDRLGPDTLLHVDLAPGASAASLARRLCAPRGRESLANHWRKRARIAGVKAGLVREAAARVLGRDFRGPEETAAIIKACPIRVLRARPLAEAISSAGGLAWDALDSALMCRALPGVFAAGEMIDWEAPTGGYLLTACLATGAWAGRAAAAHAAAAGCDGRAGVAPRRSSADAGQG